jgi:hypothetical protein
MDGWAQRVLRVFCVMGLDEKSHGMLQQPNLVMTWQSCPNCFILDGSESSSKVDEL